MAEKSLAQKLAIKPGQRIRFINAPKNANAFLSELPSERGDTGDSAADALLLFVADSSELARYWPEATASAGENAILWVAYPKRTSTVATDLRRDTGWERVIDDGFDAVSQISLDATWSALRFRRDPALRAERAARGRPGPGHRPGG